MSETRENLTERVAVFRYGLIAELVHLPPGPKVIPVSPSLLHPLDHRVVHVLLPRACEE